MVIRQCSYLSCYVDDRGKTSSGHPNVHTRAQLVMTVSSTYHRNMKLKGSEDDDSKHEDKRGGPIKEKDETS